MYTPLPEWMNPYVLDVKLDKTYESESCILYKERAYSMGFQLPDKEHLLPLLQWLLDHEGQVLLVDNKYEWRICRCHNLCHLWHEDGATHYIPRCVYCTKYVYHLTGRCSLTTCTSNAFSLRKQA